MYSKIKQIFYCLTVRFCWFLITFHRRRYRCQHRTFTKRERKTTKILCDLTTLAGFFFLFRKMIVDQEKENEKFIHTQNEKKNYNNKHLKKNLFLHCWYFPI